MIVHTSGKTLHFQEDGDTKSKWSIKQKRSRCAPRERIQIFIIQTIKRRTIPVKLGQVAILLMTQRTQLNILELIQQHLLQLLTFKKNNFVWYWTCQRTQWTTLNVQPECCHSGKELQSAFYSYFPCYPNFYSHYAPKIPVPGDPRIKSHPSPSWELDGFPAPLHYALSIGYMLKWTVAPTRSLDFARILTDLSKLHKSSKPSLANSLNTNTLQQST